MNVLFFVLVTLGAVLLFPRRAEARPEDVMVDGRHVPRGERNNNPGNIRAVDGVRWVGQIGTDDKGFVIFDTIENGYRAAGIVALNYHYKHGIDTLREFGLRWAPPDDNDGDRDYGVRLARMLGVSPDEPYRFWDDQAKLSKLLSAISINENGFVLGDEAVITVAVARATATAFA